jgi:diamine N-acetyltransferase
MAAQCPPMRLPTPSVTLGPVEDADYELMSQWASSKSWIYAGGSRHYLSPEAFRKLIESSRDTFLMVRASADGRPLGLVSYRGGQYRASFEIGTMIGDDALWQSGFGIEAVAALFGLLFDSEHAHRIEFICGVFNKPAIQALCSGLIHIEGIMRDYYYFDGTYHDAVIGSMLRDEYYAVVQPAQSVLEADRDEARNILDEYLAKNPVGLRKEQPR